MDKHDICKRSLLYRDLDLHNATINRVKMLVLSHLVDKANRFEFVMKVLVDIVTNLTWKSEEVGWHCCAKSTRDFRKCAKALKATRFVVSVQRI